MEGTLASIIGFGADFAPRSWAFCHGQLLAISSNTALFSLLGTIYGGDGRTTFALPDLRGRAAVGAGSVSGLSPIKIGQRYGVESVTLNSLQLPAHTHSATFTPSGGSDTLTIANQDANTTTPDGNSYLAARTKSGLTTLPLYASSPTQLQTIKGGAAGGGGSVTVDLTGSSQPVDVCGPRLGIHWIICTAGIYPSRS